MSDSEFEDIDLDLDFQDNVVDKPFTLPRHNIIEEFRKGLQENIRISNETKKQIQRLIEDIVKNNLKELSKIANDFLEFSDKKTLDIALIKKCLHYFKGVSEQ